jgi:hypothetical protein
MAGWVECLDTVTILSDATEITKLSSVSSKAMAATKLGRIARDAKPVLRRQYDRTGRAVRNRGDGHALLTCDAHGLDHFRTAGAAGHRDQNILPTAQARSFT